MTSTITMQSFITDVMTTVDQVIQHFVQASFTHLVQNNSQTITLVMTFYVMWYGYRAVHHKVGLDLSSVTLHLTTLLIVYALLMHWDLFERFFYNTFTNAPSDIVKSMLESLDNKDSHSTTEALNVVFNEGMQAANRLFINFSASILNNWAYLLYGLLVMVITALSCLYALALLVYAKLALAVALSLAPIFLLCLLFQSTRGFFDRWIHVLANYALIPIVTCGVLMLTLSITDITLPDLAKATQTNAGGVSGIWPLLSILGMGTEGEGSRFNQADETALQVYRQSIAANVSQSATQSLKAVFNASPTITVNQGKPILVFLNKSLQF